MTVPESLERAYEALFEPLHRISDGEVREEVMGEEVDAYVREDCRGVPTLAGAAALTLRYELASTGLGEGHESVEQDMRALGLVEAFLDPSGSEPSEVEQDKIVAHFPHPLA